MKPFLQRSGIVVGGWVLTFAMLVLFGYLFARSAPMQAMIGAQASGHLESKYGEFLAGLNNWMTIVRWVFYPILFVVLGAWVGALEKIRPLLVTTLTIIPAAAFAAAGFFGTGPLREYVLQFAIYVSMAMGTAFGFGWNRRRAGRAVSA